MQEWSEPLRAAIGDCGLRQARQTAGDPARSHGNRRCGLGALKRREGCSLWYYSELASMFSGKVLVPVEEALKRDLAAVLEHLQPAET